MTTLAHPRTTRVPRAVPAERGLTLALLVVALGLAAVALLGPLVTGIVDYRVTPTLRNQAIGLDAVSLLVAAPAALAAAVLVARGRALGPALALGLGAYTSYMLLQYVLGPDYTGRLPGNNERLFPLALVLFAAGLVVVLLAWNALDVGSLPRSRRRERLLGRVVLPVLGLAAFGRYVPSLLDWTSASPTDEGYLAGPSFAWAIALLDLGVFLPATVAACLGLGRGARWAPKALYSVAGWFGLVGPAVAAMAIAMHVNGDPVASTGSAVFTSLLGLAFLALAVIVLRPLARERTDDERSTRWQP